MYRRFGLFRRFFWFGLGIGAATLWAKHHDQERTERRNVPWYKCLPRYERQPTQPQEAPYAYDWANHKPGLGDVPAGAASPVPPPSPPQLSREEEIARLRETTKALEDNARHFAIDKLGRLSAALDKLRENLQEPPKDGKNDRVV